MSSQTKLTAAVTAAATTIHVDAATAAAFSTTGPFAIVVDNEVMSVTGGFGTTTWTVTRGTDGTTAAAHSSNSAVTLLINPESYAHSVLNPANWALQQNNSEVVGAIQSVAFGLDPTTNKWEAVVTFTSALTPGTYILSINDQVWDADYHYDPSANGGLGGIVGKHVGRRLRWNSWHEHRTARRFERPGPERFRLPLHAFRHPANRRRNPANQLTSADDQFEQEYGTGYAEDQTTHSVAMDDSGDFAVTWTRYTSDASGNVEGNVYMRLFDRNNNSLTGDVLVSVAPQTKLTSGIGATDTTIHVDAATAAQFPTQRPLHDCRGRGTHVGDGRLWHHDMDRETRHRQHHGGRAFLERLRRFVDERARIRHRNGWRRRLRGHLGQRQSRPRRQRRHLRAAVQLDGPDGRRRVPRQFKLHQQSRRSGSSP